MSDERNDEPKVAVSVEMKLNLGNYESAGASCMLSGLRADTTMAELDQLLETAHITFDLIKERLDAKYGTSVRPSRETVNDAEKGGARLRSAGRQALRESFEEPMPAAALPAWRPWIHRLPCGQRN